MHNLCVCVWWLRCMRKSQIPGPLSALGTQQSPTSLHLRCPPSLWDSTLPPALTADHSSAQAQLNSPPSSRCAVCPEEPASGFPSSPDAADPLSTYLNRYGSAGILRAKGGCYRKLKPWLDFRRKPRQPPCRPVLVEVSQEAAGCRDAWACASWRTAPSTALSCSTAELSTGWKVIKVASTSVSFTFNLRNVWGKTL